MSWIVAMRRSATATWNGSLVNASGVLSTAGGFGFNGIQDPPSSIETKSPEQRLAAVHAGCWSMMLSDAVPQGGGLPLKIKVAANLVLDNINVHGWSITSSHLVFIGKIPGAQIVAVE